MIGHKWFTNGLDHMRCVIFSFVSSLCIESASHGEGDACEGQLLVVHSLRERED